jgi:hypothetical protein
MIASSNLGKTCDVVQFMLPEFLVGFLSLVGKQWFHKNMESTVNELLGGFNF